MLILMYMNVKTWPALYKLTRQTIYTQLNKSRYKNEHWPQSLHTFYSFSYWLDDDDSEGSLCVFSKLEGILNGANCPFEHFDIGGQYRVRSLCGVCEVLAAFCKAIIWWYLLLSSRGCICQLQRWALNSSSGRAHFTWTLFNKHQPL